MPKGKRKPAKNNTEVFKLCRLYQQQHLQTNGVPLSVKEFLKQHSSCSDDYSESACRDFHNQYRKYLQGIFLPDGRNRVSKGKYGALADELGIYIASSRDDFILEDGAPNKVAIRQEAKRLAKSTGLRAHTVESHWIDQFIVEYQCIFTDNVLPEHLCIEQFINIEMELEAVSPNAPIKVEVK